MIALTAVHSGLIAAAWKARERAYAPYSQFAVGAAVLCADGRVFSGCNIENASYGLTMCAERVALFAARSASATRIVLLAVVGDTRAPIAPCGACRQVMVELAPDADVILSNKVGAVHLTRVADLLPGAFGAADLELRR